MILLFPLLRACRSVENGEAFETPASPGAALERRWRRREACQKRGAVARRTGVGSRRTIAETSVVTMVIPRLSGVDENRDETLDALSHELTSFDEKPEAVLRTGRPHAAETHSVTRE